VGHAAPTIIRSGGEGLVTDHPDLTRRLEVLEQRCEETETRSRRLEWAKAVLMPLAVACVTLVAPCTGQRVSREIAEGRVRLDRQQLRQEALLQQLEAALDPERSTDDRFAVLRFIIETSDDQLLKDWAGGEKRLLTRALEEQEQLDAEAQAIRQQLDQATQGLRRAREREQATQDELSTLQAAHEAALAEYVAAPDTLTAEEAAVLFRAPRDPHRPLFHVRLQTVAGVCPAQDAPQCNIQVAWRRQSIAAPVPTDGEWHVISGWQPFVFQPIEATFTTWSGGAYYACQGHASPTRSDLALGLDEVAVSCTDGAFRVDATFIVAQGDAHGPTVPVPLPI
jgi:hypothetical protein